MSLDTNNTQGAARGFLRTVHGDTKGYFCIWTAPDRASRFFPNDDTGRTEAAAYAILRAHDADVYFGLGLLAKPVEGGRGKVEDVTAIACLWADVDFGLGHKEPVAPDEQTARRVLDSVSPRPSVIVHSGGGLHCYWLLAEPSIFVNAEDRDKGSRLLQGWQSTIRAAFAAEGYTIDKTHDLARVLRLPGTLHRKEPANIRPVRIVHPGEGLNGNLVRYALTDFPKSVVSAPSERKAKSAPVSPSDDMGKQERRCLAYLAKCPEAISGNRGHAATLRAACECFRFGLDDAAALRVMQEFNAAKTGGEEWTEKELAHKIADARKKVDAAGEIGMRLMKAATPPRNGGEIVLGQRDPATGRIVLSPKKTLPTAEAFVEQFYEHPEGRTLVNYAGLPMAWCGNRYIEIEDESLRKQLLPWLHGALRYTIGPKGEPILTAFDANPTTVKAALDTIKTHVHLPVTVTPPLWLDGGADRPDPREMLAFKSGSLHIPADEFYSPTPALFTTSALEFDYDANAPAPARWRRFIDELWGEDPESIELLQDFFGYALTPDTVQEKILLVVGPRRSGKGTIGRVLTQLIGASNVVGPTTSSLAGPFGLQPLIGKSLAIVSDARFAGDSIPIVVERLLAISGEDAVTVDRKYLGSVTMKLPTRFVFLTNELPRLSETSGALAGRFIALRLTRSWYGQEDTRLTDDLLTELPGILLWALDGWRRLRQRGRFIQPASVQDAIRDLEDLASPVGAFVRECCVVGPGQRAWVDDLYAAWGRWCSQDGRTIVTVKQTFGRDLRAAVPGIVCRQNRPADRRFYEGIGLQTA